ncbi:hypothetical protein NDU88_007320 [Pleurodeles waltl]|uniref:Uncharacterized protein n=1 Tax=Pleurodeles waltl TaxID=8319 RepID=A0AAV7N9V3_PLEWA|nr:hypothetical protein NDU88_007320 [Pleurodeles waltl]
MGAAVPSEPMACVTVSSHRLAFRQILESCAAEDPTAPKTATTTTTLGQIWKRGTAVRTAADILTTDRRPSDALKVGGAPCGRGSECLLTTPTNDGQFPHPPPGLPQKLWVPFE